MNPSPAPLPTLAGDLLLLHAPAFFDFRQRRDIYFPFLGTSGDVPITPLYEYFPVGFKTLQRYLGERGHRVTLLNLSTILIRHPAIDVDRLIRALDFPLVGIDLHWMVHVQGSLALAQRLKALNPQVRVIFGGISSTFYARELIQYPFIDFVMRGYDTHQPMSDLLAAIKGNGAIDAVPNLLRKGADGTVRENPFSHLPDAFACGIDWSQHPAPTPSAQLPIRELLSTQNAGCAFNCGWCGGSREAFRRIFPRQRAMARKAPEEVDYEFATMQRLPDVDRFHFYSIGSYNESPAGLQRFVDHVGAARFRSVSYEQYFLTPEDVLRRMVAANPRTIITLSPESHDLRVAKLSGRGVYTNAELEAWIERALAIGVYEIDVWYFIGMPEQDAASVAGTVEYCHRLLERFRGRRVMPMLCPMIPFLDPASTFFEHPAQHGYRVFHRSVEEHRRGMERASLINRINYETRWLSRRDLVHVGFRAVRALMQAKQSVGMLPRTAVQDYVARVDDALSFIDVVDEIDNLSDPRERARELDRHGDEILRRNQQIFHAGVMNQAFPLNRQIGGRWFDELGWTAAQLAAATPTTAATAA